MGAFSKNIFKRAREARELGLKGDISDYLFGGQETRDYYKQEHEFKKKQEEMKKQQAQFEADQKRRAEESANQARLSAQLAADSGTSDTSEIQTGGDLLGDTPETGTRRRRRKASGASAVGL